MSALVVAELEPLCTGQPLSISAITHVRVDASLAYLTEAVGSSCEAGVVYEVAGARNTGHKNPVATVVDVEDDSSALSEVVLDVVGVVSLANEAETEGVNGTPDEEVAGNIAAIVSEEGLQSLGSGWAPPIDLPQSAITMATEDMRQPAWQMVCPLVPSLSEPQLESHCL